MFELFQNSNGDFSGTSIRYGDLGQKAISVSLDLSVASFFSSLALSLLTADGFEEEGFNSVQCRSTTV